MHEASRPLNMDNESGEPAEQTLLPPVARQANRLFYMLRKL